MSLPKSQCSRTFKDCESFLLTPKEFQGLEKGFENSRTFKYSQKLWTSCCPNYWDSHNIMKRGLYKPWRCNQQLTNAVLVVRPLNALHIQPFFFIQSLFLNEELPIILLRQSKQESMKQTVGFSINTVVISVKTVGSFNQNCSYFNPNYELFQSKL